MSYAATRDLVTKMLPKGGIGAEIGVWKGDYSAHILKIAQPRVLHLIDPWIAATDPEHAQAWYSEGAGLDLEQVFAGVQNRFAAQIAQGQVCIHRAPSDQAMAGLPDNSLDFVYVDGDHAYAGVRKDLDLAYAKTRSGGMICVDDHSLGKWWGDGVVRAVNEILGVHPKGLMLRFAGNSQVVLRKR